MPHKKFVRPSQYIKKRDLNDDFNSINNSKAHQYLTRDPGYWIGKEAQINSEYIFNQPNYKKNTNGGYDKDTGELKKRGKPADKPEAIFAFTPEKDKTAQELIKERKKKQQKKMEAYNKKLYRERLKTKWDRGW